MKHELQTSRRLRKMSLMKLRPIVLTWVTILVGEPVNVIYIYIYIFFYLLSHRISVTNVAQTIPVGEFPQTEFNIGKVGMLNRPVKMPYKEGQRGRFVRKRSFLSALHSFLGIYRCGKMCVARKTPRSHYIHVYY